MNPTPKPSGKAPAPPGRRRRVVVVGAGMAGLTAATRLQPRFEVVTIDKGRSVGGRLATRRLGRARLDHGAQFITTHTPEFATTVQEWAADGVAEPWFDGRIGQAGLTDADGHTRFRGVATMNAIAKHLATGLDVRTGTRVRSVAADAVTWHIDLEDGTSLEADALVLTAPVPQSLALLEAGAVLLAPQDREALSAVAYDPCTAVLAVLDGPSGMAPPGARRPSEGPIEWLADNHLKGVSAVPAVTIHATARFSEAHEADNDETVVEELLAAADLAARPLDGQVQVQRWRYARPTTLHPRHHLLAEGVPTLAFAGDAFGDAKVEGAALSGAAAARAVVKALEATGDHPADA